MRESARQFCDWKVGERLAQWILVCRMSIEGYSRRRSEINWRVEILRWESVFDFDWISLVSRVSLSYLCSSTFKAPRLSNTLEDRRLVYFRHIQYIHCSWKLELGLELMGIVAVFIWRIDRKGSACFVSLWLSDSQPNYEKIIRSNWIARVSTLIDWNRGKLRGIVTVQRDNIFTRHGKI